MSQFTQDKIMPTSFQKANKNVRCEMGEGGGKVYFTYTKALPLKFHQYFKMNFYFAI